MQPSTENHKIKIWAHEISTRKKSWIDELTTRKISYPRNTLEKKYWIHKIPTIYSREKILDPQNTHEGTMAR